MKITHKIDDFLVELFPQYKKSNFDLSILKEEITKYFTVEPYVDQLGLKYEKEYEMAKKWNSRNW